MSRGALVGGAGRLLLPPFMNVSTSDEVGELESKTGVSRSTLDAERRKSIDIVRRKLEVEPRVERLERVPVAFASSDSVAALVLVRVSCGSAGRGVV